MVSIPRAEKTPGFSGIITLAMDMSLGYARRENTAGPPVRHEGKVPRIVPLADQYLLSSRRHIVTGNGKDAVGSFVKTQAEPPGNLVHSFCRKVHIEDNLASEKIVGVYQTVDQSRIGYRGLFAAKPVAHGTRVCSGAFRPDRKESSRVDPRDAAPARAYRTYVHAGEEHGVAQDLGLVPNQGLTVPYQGDIEARSSHVHVYEVP